MLRIITFLFPAFLLLSISGNDPGKPYYHKVKAEPGDAIPTLLKRYYLHEHQCNFDQFYQLNKLDKNADLYVDKLYYIPVLIYNYNGKSIRSTLSIDSWEKALRIKDYNDQIQSDKLRRSSLTASGILWVPHHELNCQSDAKPSNSSTLAADAGAQSNKKEDPEVVRVAEEKISEDLLKEADELSGYRKFPIFGKKDAYVPLKSNKLRGKVYYIVAGHGGPDSGAVGVYGNYQLCEDEYAYDVALRIVRNLLEHGALAYMIIRDPDDGLRSGEYLPCDYDEYCWGNYKIPRNQKRRLFQRSDAVNELYERHRKQGIQDQTLVSIHIDSNNKSQQTDVFFYYFPGSKEGRELATNMHKTLESKYKTHRKSGKYHGTVTPRDLHMLREPKPNSVFIELGNIRNHYDQQRLLLENNRQALANWLYEGLIK
jgi:N-acetylmuramoyl-L-alanine amidase